MQCRAPRERQPMGREPESSLLSPYQESRYGSLAHYISHVNENVAAMCSRRLNRCRDWNDCCARAQQFDRDNQPTEECRSHSASPALAACPHCTFHDGWCVASSTPAVPITSNADCEFSSVCFGHNLHTCSISKILLIGDVSASSSSRPLLLLTGPLLNLFAVYHQARFTKSAPNRPSK